MIGELFFAAACVLAGWAAVDRLRRRKGEPNIDCVLARWSAQIEVVEKAFKDMADSQSRLADALAAKNERLERIAAQETLGANATVKRMAAIARGEA
jgi:hypothetical protein